jgi:hypothetical protein
MRYPWVEKGTWQVAANKKLVFTKRKFSCNYSPWGESDKMEFTIIELSDSFLIIRSSLSNNTEVYHRERK